MDINKRKNRIILDISAGLGCFLLGFLCIGVFSNRMLDIPVKYGEDGVKYLVSNSSFQPASIVFAAGCIFLTLSTLIFFIVISVFSRSKYCAFVPLKGLFLPSLAIFVVNLNFFTARYYSGMAELALKKAKLENKLMNYEAFNIVLSEVMFVILILVIYHGVRAKEKGFHSTREGVPDDLPTHTGEMNNKNEIPWFGIVVSLLAILQSAMGIAFRTFTVKWLWVVYASAVFIFIVILCFLGRKRRGGLKGYDGDDELNVYGFFISDHGWGHIMRTLNIMAKVLYADDDARITLFCGEKQCELAKKYMAKTLELTPEELDKVFKTEVFKTDVGLKVKDGSLELDVPGLEKMLRDYVEIKPASMISNPSGPQESGEQRELKSGTENDEDISLYEKLIRQAQEYIYVYGISSVVSDICPWALDAAKRMNVPSTLLASFSWVEIYEEYFSEDLIAPFRESYSLPDRVLFYALCNEPTKVRYALLGFDIGEIGYCARPVNWQRAYEIRTGIGVEKPIVMVTVGMSNQGIGSEIDVENVPATFIVTKGVPYVGSNVLQLDENCDESHNYVAASDFCVIKSGWTTVSECMIAGVPMGLIGRDDVAEDRMTIEMLVKKGSGMKLALSELSDPGAMLEKLMNYRFDCGAYRNCADEFAKKIAEDYSLGL